MHHNCGQWQVTWSDMDWVNLLISEMLEDGGPLGTDAAGSSSGHSWSQRLPPSIANPSISPKKSPRGSPPKKVTPNASPVTVNFGHRAPLAPSWFSYWEYSNIRVGTMHQMNPIHLNIFCSIQDPEVMRRQELQKRLKEEEEMNNKKKKKRKIKF